MRAEQLFKERSRSISVAFRVFDVVHAHGTHLPPVKRYLALLLLVLLTNLSLAETFRLQNGATITGTIKRGGGGQVILETSDGVVTHKLSDFDDATRTRLDRYNAPTPAPALPPARVATPRPVAPPSPAVEREDSTPEAKPVDIRKLPQSADEIEAFTRNLQGPRMFVYYGGLILMLIGGLWFMLRTFQQSIWWGLGCLICGIPSLFFLFIHWEKAKEPFFTQLFGVVLLFAAVYAMK
jgi:hypothetical protein